MAKTLPEVAEDVLRKRNRELKSQLRASQEQRHRAERDAARAVLELNTVEETFTAFFIAVAKLAMEVSNKSREGREAREIARKALEEAGIRPPSTLGASRQRKKSTKRRKKKT